MREASTTWAIVVGIDDYDSLPKLQGASMDAAAAVSWLRALGVQDSNILAHISPSADNAPAIEELQLPIRGCKAAEIEQSFLVLRDHRGSRLFIFLSGHGFFEPGGDRLFITQEANLSHVTNLWIDWYARMLRGLDYKRQFIFMDGCMNLPYAASQRRLISGGSINGIEPEASRDDVFQAFCYAASQGETAKEFEGRGAFMKPLLKAFDLSVNTREAWSVDERTGDFILDLDETVNTVVSPAVTDANKAQGRVQHPGYQVLSQSKVVGVVPVAVVPPETTADVSVEFGPPSAVSPVTRIEVSMDRTSWRWSRPTYSQALATKDSFRIPTGVRLFALSFAGTDWDPVYINVSVDQDTDLRLSLKPVRAPSPSPSDEGTDYGPPRGPSRGGSGPFADDRPEAESGSTKPGWGFDESASTDLELVESLTSATLEIPLTEKAAFALAGVHAFKDVISVGRVSVSPMTLVSNPRIEVAPGPALIKLSLPWGIWTHSTLLQAGEEEKIALPQSIGAPPLRTSLLNDVRFRSASVESPPRSIIGPPADQRMKMVDLDGRQSLGTIEVITRGDTGLWKGPIFRMDSIDPAPWSTYAAIKNGGEWLALPLNDLGPLGISLGEAPRAEPLSLTMANGWDSLVASGDLRKISDAQADELTYMKWDEPLLGVAASYALHAARNTLTLREVLTNMTSPHSPMLAEIAGLPDLDILQATLSRSDKSSDASARQRLERLSLSAHPPVFRWGLAIGIDLALRHGVMTLAERYKDIERRLIPGSVWTMWRI